MNCSDVDFKYVLQDLSHVYIGSRSTYEELVANEDIPGKLRSALYKIIQTEEVPEILLQDHLYIMEEDSYSFFVFKQLKMTIKAMELHEGKTITGKITKKHKEKLYTITGFVHGEQKKKQKSEVVIQEISFKKLNLLMLDV